MQRAPQVSVKAVRICLLVAAARGLPIDPATFGIGAELADPFARIPHPLLARLWTEIPERLGDDLFGLHATQIVQAHAFDVVDHVTRTCATLGQSLATMIRYARLVHDAYDVRLEIDGDVARYSVRFACTPPMPRQLIDFILCSWVLRIRRGIDGELRVHAVQLPHPAPADASAHTRALDVPVEFDAETAAIVFDRAMLDTPLLLFDPDLNALLDRQAASMLAAREQDDPADDHLIAQLRQHVAATLPHGNATVDEVARRLGMSRRSLQRHLHERGSSFAGVVDATRRRLALEHMAVTGRTLCEIAFLTGFSDASAFTRAFRRWTGETPSAHRQRVERLSH